MKRLNFSTKINAPRERVWDILWNDDTYQQWTSVFCEGSYVVTDWKEGDKALFLSSEKGGMYSVIEKNTVNEFMSFKHLGIVKDGNELPVDDETKRWSGAMENYTLKEQDGATELFVEMDITADHISYFNDAFPKGLQKVKELAENDA